LKLVEGDLVEILLILSRGGRGLGLSRGKQGGNRIWGGGGNIKTPAKFPPVNLAGNSVALSYPSALGAPLFVGVWQRGQACAEKRQRRDSRSFLVSREVGDLRVLQKSGAFLDREEEGEGGKDRSRAVIRCTAYSK